MKRKRTLFFDENEERAFLICQSRSHADLSIACAKMILTPTKYNQSIIHDTDTIELARRMQGKTIIKVSLDDINCYYLRQPCKDENCKCRQ